MRSILIILSLSISFTLTAQTCVCETIKNYGIPCDTITFSNGSLFYFQNDCESVWKVLELNNGKKITIDAPRLPGFAARSGSVFLKEYKEEIVFAYHWITGCCQPPDIVFYDKDNGQETRRISSHDLITFDEDSDLLLYFIDDNYNSLKAENVLTKKTQTITLPTKGILSAMQKGLELFPSNLFDLSINKEAITIKYRFVNATDKEEIGSLIILDL